MRKVASVIGQGALGILFIFIFIFNLLAGVVGGIWLLCIGHWRIVLLGFLASILMPYWWIIVSIPSFGLIALLAPLEEKKNKVGIAIVGFLGGLYSSFLIMGWLAVVFSLALLIAREKEIFLIPLLLFAYSVATAPLLYMASKEPPDDESNNLTMSIVVLGSILIVILSFFKIPLIYPLIILGIFMVLRTILLIALGISMMPEKETDYLSDILTKSEEEEYYEQEINHDNEHDEEDEQDYYEDYDEEKHGFED